MTRLHCDTVHWLNHESGSVKFGCLATGDLNLESARSHRAPMSGILQRAVCDHFTALSPRRRCETRYRRPRLKLTAWCKAVIAVIVKWSKKIGTGRQEHEDIRSLFQEPSVAKCRSTWLKKKKKRKGNKTVKPDRNVYYSQPGPWNSRWCCFVVLFFVLRDRVIDLFSDCQRRSQP